MPTKEEVRKWMQQRQKQPAPPPTPADIRRQLGWELEPNNKRAVCAR